MKTKTILKRLLSLTVIILLITCDYSAGQGDTSKNSKPKCRKFKEALKLKDSINNSLLKVIEEDSIRLSNDSAQIAQITSQVKDCLTNLESSKEEISDLEEITDSNYALFDSLDSVIKTYESVNLRIIKVILNQTIHHGNPGREVLNSLLGICKSIEPLYVDNIELLELKEILNLLNESLAVLSEPYNAALVKNARDKLIEFDLKTNKMYPGIGHQVSLLDNYCDLTSECYKTLESNSVKNIFSFHKKIEWPPDLVLLLINQRDRVDKYPFLHAEMQSVIDDIMNNRPSLSKNIDVKPTVCN